MKKNGFTLIELLAVIIILAVIALISTPLILDVVDEAKKQANFESALAYLESAKLYYYEAQLDSSKMSDLENLNNIYDKVVIKGTKPETGELYATANAQFALAVLIEGDCYYKDFDEELAIKELETCSLGYVGKDDVKPTVQFSYVGEEGNNGWYVGDVSVTISILDSESGPTSFKWCYGSACEPNYEEETATKTLVMDTDTDTIICVLGYDKYGNASEKVCSKEMKIDKQGPTFNGISNLTVEKGKTADLRDGITVNDNLSGVNGFTVTPETISTDTVGTTTVTYKAIDNAGNETEITRTIIIEAPKLAYRCKRADVGTLHQETCMHTSGLYCHGAGYSVGNKGTTIEYGKLGEMGKDLKSGDALNCDVNGDNIFDPATERFYYVSSVYDYEKQEFDDEYAALIYYTHTFSGVASTDGAPYNRNMNNWVGPETAAIHLPTVNSWTNVSLKSTTRQILNELGGNTTTGGTLGTFTYTKSDGTAYAARLLTVKEVETACGLTVGGFGTGELDGKCEYMYEKTAFSTTTYSTVGTWLENPREASSTEVWNVSGDARRANYMSSFMTNLGVRPVIEVKYTEILH